MDKRLSETLKSKKLRFTKARQTVFDILSKSDRALSPREVFIQTGNLSDIRTDQVSVYRNLTLFTQLGLTHRFQDGRYSLCKQNHKREHKHLHIIASCYRCGKTYEIKKHSDKICQLAKSFKNFVKSFGNFNRLTMEGICRNCKSSECYTDRGSGHL